MVSNVPRTPGYLLHKATGQARVRIHGRDYFWVATTRRKAGNATASCSFNISRTTRALRQLSPADWISVAELVSQYVEFAEEHYSYNPDELYRIKAAIRLLIEHYGSLGVNDFSPKKLKDVRQRIIDRRNSRTGRPLSRKYVNQLTSISHSADPSGVVFDFQSSHQSLGYRLWLHFWLFAKICG